MDTNIIPLDSSLDKVVVARLVVALDHLKRLRGEEPGQIPEQIRPNDPDEIAQVFGQRAAALAVAMLMLLSEGDETLTRALNGLAVESLLAVGWRLKRRPAGALLLFNASGDRCSLPLGALTLSSATDPQTLSDKGGDLARVAALIWLDDLRMELKR